MIPDLESINELTSSEGEEESIKEGGVNSSEGEESIKEGGVNSSEVEESIVEVNDSNK